MFINLIEFPPIKAEKEEKFLEWFKWSNEIYSSFDGFISRRLLRSTQDRKYAAVVEHESEATFMAMHNSPERQKAWQRVEKLLDGAPTPHFYEVVISSS